MREGYARTRRGVHRASELALTIDAQHSWAGWHDWLPLADAPLKKPSRATKTR